MRGIQGDQSARRLLVFFQYCAPILPAVNLGQLYYPHDLAFPGRSLEEFTPREVGNAACLFFLFNGLRDGADSILREARAMKLLRIFPAPRFGIGRFLLELSAKSSLRSDYSLHARFQVQSGSSPFRRVDEIGELSRIAHPIVDLVAHGFMGDQVPLRC